MKDRVVILHINDSTSDRADVTRELRAAGWTVLEAPTGREGLELLRAHEAGEKDALAHEKAEALTEADRRKDEFLAMLAHELRNPLSAIMTAHTLLEQIALPVNASRLTGTIGRQTRHLTRLVDDLLDVSRITRGKIQLRKESCDLAAILERFLSGEAAPATKERTLTLDISREPMWVDGDVTRIEQVFANLISNAVKFSAPGGEIRLSLSAETRGDERIAVLVISDDGIGIAKEDLGSVFDLFFQIDPTLARSQAGLGIGLTMVKRLVELHAGAIAVRSEGPGRGSEFRVELPLVAPKLVAPAVEASKKKSAPLSVLLVDDNEDSCDLLALAFENEGHRVETAHDGEAGLALALAKPFDLAVIDIGLPIVDGYEVARGIRASVRGATTLLLALTGYGQSEDKARALAAGFDAHLVKPIDLAALQRLVAELMANRKAAPLEQNA